MMTPFHHLSTSFTLASKVGGGHFSAEIASKVKETLNFFLFRLFFFRCAIASDAQIWCSLNIRRTPISLKSIRPF